MEKNQIVIEGRVKPGKYVHERVTKVKPVENHYEELGEKPYIKYGCPVCESLGNHFSFPHGVKNCPLCNVNLLWGSWCVIDHVKESIIARNIYAEKEALGLIDQFITEDKLSGKPYDYDAVWLDNDVETYEQYIEEYIDTM